MPSPNGGASSRNARRRGLRRWRRWQLHLASSRERTRRCTHLRIRSGPPRVASRRLPCQCLHQCRLLASCVRTRLCPARLTRSGPRVGIVPRRRLRHRLEASRLPTALDRRRRLCRCASSSRSDAVNWNPARLTGWPSRRRSHPRCQHRTSSSVRTVLWPPQPTRLAPRPPNVRQWCPQGHCQRCGRRCSVTTRPSTPTPIRRDPRSGRALRPHRAHSGARCLLGHPGSRAVTAATARAALMRAAVARAAASRAVSAHRLAHPPVASSHKRRSSPSVAALLRLVRRHGWLRRRSCLPLVGPLHTPRLLEPQEPALRPLRRTRSAATTAPSGPQRPRSGPRCRPPRPPPPPPPRPSKTRLRSVGACLRLAWPRATPRPPVAAAAVARCHQPLCGGTTRPWPREPRRSVRRRDVRARPMWMTIMRHDAECGVTKRHWYTSGC